MTRVTASAEAPGDGTGGPVTGTQYSADGRVVRRGSGPTPDGVIDPRDPRNARDGNPPDEPHVID